MLRRLQPILWTLPFLALAATPVFADDPAPPVPDIVFPDVTPPAPPVPPPAPAPDVTPLPANVYYVVQSEKPFFAMAFPNNVLSLQMDAGPLRMRGRFVEAPDKVVTKTFKAKHLLIVEAAGTGRAELVVVPAGATVEKNLIRRTIDANTGPQPPPGPGPGPGPTPQPGQRVPKAKAAVLILEDSAKRSALTKDQFNVLFAQDSRNALNAATPDEGGKHRWRIYDPSRQDLSGVAKYWQDWAKLDPSRPYLVIGDATTGAVSWRGPITSPSDLTATLTKFIGD
jgi:hypothetical protein